MAEENNSDGVYVLDGAMEPGRVYPCVGKHVFVGAFPANYVCSREVQLSVVERPSEPQLAHFFSCYSPLARTAFLHAKSPEAYEHDLITYIWGLNSTQLRAIIYNAWDTHFEGRISHHFLVANPVSNNRRRESVAIPTKHLTEMLLAQLRLSDRHAALHLYCLFSATPRTRCSSVYLSEVAFLEEFPKGGEWPVTIMQKKKPSAENTHWHFDNTASHKYLRLGYPSRPVSVKDTVSGDVVQATPLPRNTFSKSLKQLHDGFYIPASASPPFYDAFVYDSRLRTATIFQVTVSKDHDIKASALQDLLDRHVYVIDLVVVTCPEGARDVWISDSLSSSLRNVYHLELSGGDAREQW